MVSRNLSASEAVFGDTGFIYKSITMDKKYIEMFLDSTSHFT